MREGVVEACSGCNKVDMDDYCMCYLFTGVQWRRGNCPMATHIKKEIMKERMMDPLKASRRKSRGK